MNHKAQERVEKIYLCPVERPDICPSCGYNSDNQTACCSQLAALREVNREYKVNVQLMLKENAEAKAEIGHLHEKLSALCDSEAAKTFGELRFETKRLREALALISSYDSDSKHGKGICPYGCDTPYIAQSALDGGKA